MSALHYNLVKQLSRLAGVKDAEILRFGIELSPAQTARRELLR
jgi:hypothetical protein